MNGRKLTKWFCGISLAIIILYDVYVYLGYGVEATISRFVWYLTFDYPPVGQLLLLSVGFLLGHLFWPQKIVLGKKDLE